MFARIHLCFRSCFFLLFMFSKVRAGYPRRCPWENFARCGPRPPLPSWAQHQLRPIKVREEGGRGQLDMRGWAGCALRSLCTCMSLMQPDSPILALARPVPSWHYFSLISRICLRPAPILEPRQAFCWTGGASEGRLPPMAHAPSPPAHGLNQTPHMRCGEGSWNMELETNLKPP